MIRRQHVRGPFAWADKLDCSQAVVANGLVFVSGQWPADDQGGIAPGDFQEQARLTFRNLGRVLNEAGASYEDLVHVRTYLLDQADYDAYKEVRREFLSEPFPATLLICVRDFSFPGMLIEIEAVAQLPSG